MQLSPETEGDSHVRYYYGDEFIEGFSHLRVPGGGSQGKGGGMLIKPGIGKFTPKIADFCEKYIKSEEEASAGYYKLALESGVKAELTVSERVGFHSYLVPYDLVQPVYLIGSPIFPELTLHFENGKSFTVIANDVSEDNFYIQSAKLNGKPFDEPWIDYQTLMAGGTLEFEMGSQPNKEWESFREIYAR